MAGTPLHIRKFESTGNDFILCDNRDGSFSMTGDEIALLCHRRFGAGADGLILLESHPELDFRMRYFNSDGLEASFCGNGGRAITGFARIMGLKGNRFSFEAFDGIHEAVVESESNQHWEVSLGMQDVHVSGEDFINTGSPHHLVSVADVASIDVRKDGAALRYSERFAPDGCNVNFIQEQGDSLIVRTYERGVEGETLSCGTGVTASAIFYHRQHADGEYTTKVVTTGGELKVSFRKVGNHYSRIRLSGPTRCTFSGVYYL